MPDWQKRVRTEGRDKFFYWTAVFGSECSSGSIWRGGVGLIIAHTFFMTFLPMLFWLGYLPRARGSASLAVPSMNKELMISLLHVTGLGIWLSSFLKDLACAPRPFSPPMVRLTMSTHAHEYGMSPESYHYTGLKVRLSFFTLYELRQYSVVLCSVDARRARGYGLNSSHWRFSLYVILALFGSEADSSSCSLRLQCSRWKSLYWNAFARWVSLASI
jgi:hypothetical protein